MTRIGAGSGGTPVNRLRGAPSVSSLTGSRATSSSPSITVTAPSSVTSPITAEVRSHSSKIRCTSRSRPRRTTTSIRSWDSDSITSYGLMLRSRRGTRKTSIRAPAPATRPAHSATDDVSPAAPRSWMATTASVRVRSMQASRRHFSRNGLPTCTAGRREALSSSSSNDANDAPWIPSRPVSAPTSSSLLPAPSARARISWSARTRPTHIAFTSGLLA